MATATVVEHGEPAASPAGHKLGRDASPVGLLFASVGSIIGSGQLYSALRKQDPDRERPYRLPVSPVLAPLGFVAAHEVLLFSGWAVVWKLIVAIVFGFALLALSSVSGTIADRPSLRH